MVKKEEQQKEEQESVRLQSQIAKEEYKAECLEKAFQERELDDDFVESQKDSMDDLDEIHQQARKKIVDARNKLRHTIQQMKLKSKNKNQSLQNKLKMIRTKMSKQIMLANKNGNIETCRKGRKDADFRESYCNENFVDDWTRNADCKGDDFCYICCESEFGAMYVTSRDNCYKMCDYKPKKKKGPIEAPKMQHLKLNLKQPKANEEPTKVDDGVGRWVWAPKQSTSGGVTEGGTSNGGKK